MKGDLVYTDGTMRVVIKRKYAYYYNIAGIFYGRAEVDETLFSNLKKAGFVNSAQIEKLSSLKREQKSLSQ